MAEAILADVLTSVARVKTRLSITVTDFDTLLLRIISASSDFIKRQCGVGSFKETSYSNEIYSCNKGNQQDLFLKNVPVTALTVFQYNVGSKTVPVWTDFGADEYDYDGPSGIIHYDGCLPIGLNNLRVSYAAGYKIDFTAFGDLTKHTLPADLTDLCERMAIKWFKKRDSEGKASESEGNSNITWEKELSEEDKATILQHKRIIFA